MAKIFKGFNVLDTNSHKKGKLAAVITELMRERGLHLGLNEKEVNESFQKVLKVLYLDWLKLLVSEWLSSKLFSFLTLADVVNLDTAICSHSTRSEWLSCLHLHFPCKSIQCSIFNENAIKWYTLKQLKFEHICLNSKFEIADKNYFKLAQLCENLKILEMDQVNVGEKVYQYFGGYCKKLESLELHGASISDNTLTVFGKCFKSLKVIDIYIDNTCNVADVGILALLNYNTHLVKFTWDDRCFESASDVILSYLGTFCPLLQHIGVFLRVSISTTESIQIFAKGCKFLKSVKLGDVNMVASSVLLESLGLYCPLLESLSYCGIYSTEISPNQFIINNDEITAAFKVFAIGCPLLNTLSVSFLALTTQAIVHLVNHCSALCNVQFTKNFITDESLLELGKLKSLTSLNLSLCHCITDQGIANLLCGNNKSSNSLLQVLKLSGCSKLTDESCITIAKHCSETLTKISICNANSNLTAVGFIELHNHCKKLQRIENNCCDFALSKICNHKVLPEVIETELRLKNKLAAR